MSLNDACNIYPPGTHMLLFCIHHAFITRQWTSACHMHPKKLKHNLSPFNLPISITATLCFGSDLIHLHGFAKMLIIDCFVLRQYSTALFCAASCYLQIFMGMNIRFKVFFCVLGSTLKRLCLGKERGSM